jgi:glycerol-3-phosphate dehydrogenase
LYRRIVTQREHALERLRAEPFDLLVVGGGIIGAGIAEAASRHGFRVALVERDDFASGTSSASSKLVHGGLRYLRLGHFSLVREALAEVHALSRFVAPHLVRPLNFVLPVYRGGPYGRIPIRGALWSYAGLTGAVSERGRMIAPAAAAQLVPQLRLDGLRAAGLYPDAQTDDARLCLANLRGAEDAGAVIVNRVELAGLERGPVAYVRDTRTGETSEVRPRAVVNAAGPWVDDVRRLEDARAGTSVTLGRGAHLVLERDDGWGAAVTIPVDRTRVAFAVPWAGRLLVGTTDSAFEGDARSIEPTEAEERQILAEAGLALEAAALGPVRARFAGIRVLPAGAAATARAHRETMLSSGPLGMVSVAGGKLTTYRRIALAVLHQLRSELELHRIDRRPRPLPGAADPDVAADALRRRHPDLDARLAAHLAGTYGSLADEVIAAGPLEPLGDGLVEVEAQVLYARGHEWALSAEDVLRRRLTLSITGRDSDTVRGRVESLLAS